MIPFYRICKNERLWDKLRLLSAWIQTSRLHDAVNTVKYNQVIQQKLDYTANIANHKAKSYYENQGITSCAPAFEIERPKGRTAIMFCKYCIRHELGLCKKSTSKKNTEIKEPLTLHSADGRQFELSFDCKNCEMTVWANIE